MADAAGRVALLGQILLTVTLNSSAQLLLRLGARQGFGLPGHTVMQNMLDIALRPAIVGGVACYGISILLWIWVLGRAEASFAYPFLGLGFVLVMIAGTLWLGETFSIQRLIATALITAGVVVMAAS